MNINNNIPFYIQLEEMLANEINSAKRRSGDRLESVRDLAKKHSLSIFTVQRAISNLKRKGYLETKRGKGTFVAQNRGNGKGDTEGLAATVGFVSEFSPRAFENTNFFSNLLKGLYRTCRMKNRHLLCLQPETETLRPAFVPTSIVQNFELSGLILMSYNASYLMKFKSLNYPLVVVDNDMSYAGFDSVTFENRQSAYELTKALIEKGAKRICYIGLGHKQDNGSYHVRDESVWERFAGVKRAVSEFNLPEFDGQYFHVDTLSEDDPQMAAAKILELHQHPDAIITFDAKIGNQMGPIIAKKDSGSKIIIASFSNPEFFDQASFLDAIAICDEEKMAEEALNVLFRRIADPDLIPVKTEIPMEITFRN